MRNLLRTGLIFLLFSLVAGTAQAQVCKPESIPASTPDSQLQDNGDGTVTDLKTGLMWKQCAEGQSGSGCAEDTANDTATEYPMWQNALLRAQEVNTGGGFAGFTDWRVPNIKELASLVEHQCTGPAINLTRFPNTPSSYFGSSSIQAGRSAYFWTVSPYGLVMGGSTNVTHPLLSKAWLRLVRSAP
ncbi:MAG: DUF1566 domain-containing protein [Aeromonadaceae bacterium]